MIVFYRFSLVGQWALFIFKTDQGPLQGISIQGPEAIDLFCQRIEELRKCQEEDGEESSEEDPESSELGQLLNSLSECHSLLNSRM